MHLTPFIAFYLSGASSLIFQLIWSRYLHHVFGSSSLAISTVVSVFMSGLALGTWLFGRYADKFRKPLLLYACAELGVGGWGLLIPILVRNEGWLAELNQILRNTYGAESTSFIVMRFVCIVPILIVPTTLMGSTLPLLARYFVETQQSSTQASSRVGVLYAVNTFGAVSGIFLAGFVLMPNIGIQATNLAAVSINFLLATLIFCLNKKLHQIPNAPKRQPSSTYKELGKSPISPRNEPTEPEYAPSTSFPRSTRLMAAIGFGISGAISLLYEVVWSRALINTIGASVYSFALILMTFLSGIAIGSALASSILFNPRYRLMVFGITSIILSILANMPLILSIQGFVFWLVLSILSVAVISSTVFLAYRKRKTIQLLSDSISEYDQDTPWILTMLLIPVICTGLVLTSRSEYLSSICFSVIFLLCLFLCLILVFRRNFVLLIALIQLYIGGATLTSDIWADEISLAFATMVSPLYDSLPDHVNLVMGMMSFTVALCVLPSALGMGAMFPVIMRIWSSGGQRIGRDVSIVYTGNTIGSIIGAWLPGFILMPLLGMQNTLHIGIGLNLLLSLIFLLITPLHSDSDSRKNSPLTNHNIKSSDLEIERYYGLNQQKANPNFNPFFWSGAFTLQSLIVHLFSGLIPVLLAFLYINATNEGSLLRWNISKMTLGTFRISLAKSVLDSEAWGEPELVFYRDGISTTVTVERWGRHYALKNNGKVDASNGGDMPTQIMVAALPLLMHPEPDKSIDMSIIGFGSGVTVGSALQFPVRSVDVVELERAVVEGSKYFSADNHLQYNLKDYPYVKMPRLRVINDDGRNFLASTTRAYDVIVSEPSNPWLTGVSDLFTTDYFRITKRKLKPGGIYCQWVQLYEMSPENVKIVYRTFASHFKQVIVFSAEELASDTILIGSDAPLKLDLEIVSKKMGLLKVKDELSRAFIDSPFDLFARVLLASREEIMNYTQVEYRLHGREWKYKPTSTNLNKCPPRSCRRTPVPLNTDDNALIEFAAPRDLIGFERYSGYLETVYASDWPYGIVSKHYKGFGTGNEEADNLARQAMSLMSHGKRKESMVFIELSKMAGSTKSSRFIIELLNLLIDDKNEPQIDLIGLDLGLEIEPHHLEKLNRSIKLVSNSLDGNDYESALNHIKKLPAFLRWHSGSGIQFLYGYLHYKKGDNINVIGELEEIVRKDEKFVLAHPEVYYFLARSQNATRHFNRAVTNMRTYLEKSKCTPEKQDDPNCDQKGINVF